MGSLIDLPNEVWFLVPWPIDWIASIDYDYLLIDSLIGWSNYNCSFTWSDLQSMLCALQ